MLRVLPGLEAALWLLVTLLKQSCKSWGIGRDVRSWMLRDAWRLDVAMWAMMRRLP